MPTAKATAAAAKPKKAPKKKKTSAAGGGFVGEMSRLSVPLLLTMSAELARRTKKKSSSSSKKRQSGGGSDECASAMQEIKNKAESVLAYPSASSNPASPSYSNTHLNQAKIENPAVVPIGSSQAYMNSSPNANASRSQAYMNSPQPNGSPNALNGSTPTLSQTGGAWGGSRSAAAAHSIAARNHAIAREFHMLASSLRSVMNKAPVAAKKKKAPAPLKKKAPKKK